MRRVIVGIVNIVEPPNELAYQYKYSVPGFTISWEVMVAKLSDELREDPRPIEITTEDGKDRYDEVLTGTLIGIFLTRTKLCMLSSDLNIEPIHIRRDTVSLPVMFPNGRFYFRVLTARHISGYTIYL